MENNMNLKELWNKQAVPQADASGIVEKIKNHKAAGMRKIILLNVLLSATIIFVMLIWVYFKPQLLTTKIGIILTILPMFIALVFQNRMIPLYKKQDESQSNADYLNNLLEIKSKERFIQTTIMNVYFSLLSAGFLLYLYEYTALMPFYWGIFAYSIVVLWIGFNWFVLRPKVIKKNREKLDGLIRQLEILRRGLNDNSRPEV